MRRREMVTLETIHWKEHCGPTLKTRPGQRDVVKALIAGGGRSPWLSGISGFDPYAVDGLLVNKNENGEVMVGSIPLFLGANGPCAVDFPISEHD